MILTGGVAAAPWARDVAGVDLIDPDLTLKGLAILHTEVAGGDPYREADPDADAGGAFADVEPFPDDEAIGLFDLEPVDGTLADGEGAGTRRDRTARGPAHRPRRVRLDRRVQGRRARAAAAGGGRRRRRDAHPVRRDVRRPAHVRRPVAARRRDRRPGPAPRPADRAHRGRRHRRRDRRGPRDGPLAGRDGERHRERRGHRDLPRDRRAGRGRAGDGRRHVDAPGDARQRRAAAARLRVPHRAAGVREPRVGPVGRRAASRSSSGIVDAVVEAIGAAPVRQPDAAARPPIVAAAREPDLEGRHVVVSAGGTAEAIDPVRFIGNRSTGRMGVAIAEAALARGRAGDDRRGPGRGAAPRGRHRRPRRADRRDARRGARRPSSTAAPTRS